MNTSGVHQQHGVVVLAPSPREAPPRRPRPGRRPLTTHPAGQRHHHRLHQTKSTGSGPNAHSTENTSHVTTAQTGTPGPRTTQTLWESTPRRAHGHVRRRSGNCSYRVPKTSTPACRGVGPQPSPRPIQEHGLKTSDGRSRPTRRPSRRVDRLPLSRAWVQRSESQSQVNWWLAKCTWTSTPVAESGDE